MMSDESTEYIAGFRHGFDAARGHLLERLEAAHRRAKLVKGPDGIITAGALEIMAAFVLSMVLEDVRFATDDSDMVRVMDLLARLGGCPVKSTDHYDTGYHDGVCDMRDFTVSVLKKFPPSTLRDALIAELTVLTLRELVDHLREELE